ncbi:hypothetical protein [Actinoallomurus iriomotensis]|uniref:hypothetical protein n=1 Tax=Actinoallomurus iriomotensis TaxID=478107 RepID=UPI002553AC9D|nr:hypothetical protein [Actinoallomurus iriomotensis]
MPSRRVVSARVLDLARGGVRQRLTRVVPGAGTERLGPDAGDLGVEDLRGPFGRPRSRRHRPVTVVTVSGTFVGPSTGAPLLPPDAPRNSRARSRPRMQAS